VIWSVASMHHWDDRDRGLADLVRTLAPGGRLLIAEKALKRPGHGITEQQAQAVTALLKRLGQVEVRSVGKPRGALRRTLSEATRRGQPGDGAAAAPPDGPAAD